MQRAGTVRKWCQLLFLTCSLLNVLSYICVSVACSRRQQSYAYHLFWSAHKVANIILTWQPFVGYCFCNHGVVNVSQKHTNGLVRCSYICIRGCIPASGSTCGQIFFLFSCLNVEVFRFYYCFHAVWHVGGSFALYDCCVQPTLCIQINKMHHLCEVFLQPDCSLLVAFLLVEGLPCIVHALNAFFWYPSSGSFCLPMTLSLSSCPSLVYDCCRPQALNLNPCRQSIVDTYSEHVNVWPCLFGCKCDQRDFTSNQGGTGKERHGGDASFGLA